MTQNELRTPTPLHSVDLEAVLAEARLHWPKRELPPLTAREVDALESGAKVMPLTRGKWAIVDAQDYDWLCVYNWHADPHRNTIYARRHGWENKKSLNVYLHRAVCSSALHIDHRDGDGLNNRRSNLRAATNSQNIQNSRLNRKNTTGYKGVCLVKTTGRYAAFISVNYKTRYLGTYDTPELAHAARMQAAAIHHGQFARTA